MELIGKRVFARRVVFVIIIPKWILWFSTWKDQSKLNQPAQGACTIPPLLGSLALGLDANGFPSPALSPLSGLPKGFAGEPKGLAGWISSLLEWNKILRDRTLTFNVSELLTWVLGKPVAWVPFLEQGSDSGFVWCYCHPEKTMAPVPPYSKEAKNWLHNLPSSPHPSFTWHRHRSTTTTSVTTLKRQWLILSNLSCQRGSGPTASNTCPAALTRPSLGTGIGPPPLASALIRPSLISLTLIRIRIFQFCKRIYKTHSARSFSSS